MFKKILPQSELGVAYITLVAVITAVGVAFSVAGTVGDAIVEAL